MDDDSLEEFLLAAKTEWYLRRDFLANYQQNISQEAYVLGAFLVGVCVGLLIPRICQPFRRFMTVEEIPLNYFQQRRKIHGVAVSFSDGDTFRARHLPFWRGPGAIDGKMSKNTLQIRLAGIGECHYFEWNTSFLSVTTLFLLSEEQIPRRHQSLVTKDSLTVRKQRNGSLKISRISV
jgi:hypothetical protein